MTYPMELNSGTKLAEMLDNPISSGEGLREAARDGGGVALCRIRLPLPPAGSRRSHRGFITRSRGTGGLAAVP